MESPPDDAAQPERCSSPPLKVALIAAFAFLPSLLADYVYDDRLLITQNYYAQSLRFIGRAFRTHLWDVHAFGSAGIGLRYYRPVVTVSYILNWVLGAGTAWSFHLVNVVVHAAATLLATRAAIRWTSNVRLGVLAGLLFALHPSRTESVIWISGRTDVFMAFFALLAVELAHRAGTARRERVLLFAGGAFLSTVAATLSKEAGALTALLFLPDLLSVRRGTVARGRLVRLSAVVGGAGALYVASRSLFYPVHKTHVPLEPTLRYGLVTVWGYVERLVFPWPQTFFYRPMEERGGAPFYPPSLVALGVLACAAFAALLVHAFRRDRAAFVLLGTAAVLLGPLLNFTYTGIYVTTSDHFLYLPVFVAAAGACRLFAGESARFAATRVATLAVAALCIAYAGVDAERVLDYRSEEAELRHEVQVNPDNPVALQSLGGLVARTGDIQSARAFQARAVAPSATRFFLLAGPPATRALARARLIGFDAALTADGDVVALGRYEDELEGLLFSLHSSEDDSPLSRAGVFKEMTRNAHVASLGADAALIASRIGRVKEAKSFVDAIPDDMLWHVSNSLNFVLTVARLGDFKRAAHLVDIAKAPPPGLPVAAPPEAILDVRGRLSRARVSMRAALHAKEPGAHVELALSFAELGAYLQALRVLRPVFDAVPHPPDVEPLYVQLLLSARLEEEALAVATRLLGAGPAAEAVGQVRAQLGPRLLSLRRVPEPAPWWP